MEQLIEKFYLAFAELDARKMAECYHDDIIFEDPAFGKLKGPKAKNMWLMLCQSQKGEDFHIQFSNISADDDKGKASWEARYTFSKTGRKVHNVIHAHFEFKDGKIIKHTDSFDLYRWARQAMGLAGYLLGWTPYFKKKLQVQTNRMLDKFETSLEKGKG